MVQIYKCSCGNYTMERVCPVCKKTTQRASPPKYKISDKYASLRQKMMKNE